MKLSKLLNCAVYDENGTAKGVVGDVKYDVETNKCMPVIDGVIYDVDGIKASKTQVTIRGAKTPTGEYTALIGKEIYDASGKRLGVIADAAFYDADMRLKEIAQDNGERYVKSRIFGINDVAIIKVAKPKKSNKPVKNEHIDIRASDDIKQKSAKKEPDKAVAPAQSVRMRRRYGDFSFLLGKTADKSITNFYGEVMVRAGETVTSEILKQAKLSGKLIELCLHVF